MLQNKQESKKRSFNPCFNGTYSLTASRAHVPSALTMCVLILVLMELTL